MMTNPSHLGANNFTIGHDFSVTQGTLKSVFKKDYLDHDAYGRAEQAKPPRLGDVMHIDDAFNNRVSETSTAFEYRHLKKPVLLDVGNKLRLTNFKMDADKSKVDSFHTTHDHYFQQRVGEDYRPPTQTQSIHGSSIPQGDILRAEVPISDYKYKFSGNDGAKVVRAKNMHHEGPVTIKGDNRLSHFTSASRTQFQGDWLPKLPSLPVPRTQNVPLGDPDKEKTKLSVMQSSFDNYSDQLKTHTPFDTGAVSGQLRKTNYKEKDGHGVWDNYETTTSSAFPEKNIDPSMKHSAMRHRNASDFPDGDRERIRDKERMSLTTARFYHGNPARGLHNRIVSGANKRTASQVWFGDPDLEKQFYSTTTKEVFKPKSVPYSYDRQSCYIPSCIPLSHDNCETHETTVSADYTNPNQERMIPNPKAIESLAGSHIKPPQKHMTFDTTHGEEFTNKPMQALKYDAGRLQRSSVPLGTMAH